MSKKTKQQKHQERMAAKEHHVDEVELAAHEHDDDLIVAPKGMSRRRFLFTLGVTIFVVLAFVIPGAFMSTMGGGNNPLSREYVSWTGPDGTKRGYSVADFQREKQAHDRLLRGMFGQRQTISDEDMAAFLLEDELSLAAGIVITDNDLRSFLTDQLGFKDGTQLAAFARNFRMTVSGLEGQMRRWLRVQRYKSFLIRGVQLPDTAEVERQWKDQFKEYKFTFIQASADDFDEAARAAVPADEELQAWFNALPDFQKNNFMTERKMSAEFIVFELNPLDPPTQLLEAFPAAEDFDLDLAAQNYYDLVKSSRFARELEKDEEGNDIVPDDPADTVLPFEEVAEACKAEVPTYNSLREWMRSISAKANDPAQEFDFTAEAIAVGLTVESDNVARSQSEWEEVEVVGSSRLANMLRFSAEGALLPAVTATEKAMIVGRTTKVENPRMPEFAEMREDVVDAWVETSRADIALEKLTELYNGFLASPEDKPTIGGIDVEEEAFRTAATAAGFEVSVRDWRDRVMAPPGGFAEAEPVELYLRQNPMAFILTDGQVSEPSLDGGRKDAFMMRLEGSRDPELVTMMPGRVRDIENTVMNRAATDFAEQAFSFNAYETRYNLALFPAEPEAE